MNPIEKLINEHGSSNILRERLLLASDQYSALEKEKSCLKSENEILKTENANLKIENQKLSEKIAVYDRPAKKTPKLGFNSNQIPPRNMI